MSLKLFLGLDSRQKKFHITVIILKESTVRYSDNHKAETRQRIIAKAAEEFRRNGLNGIGIANLMSTLGLTHGGFYAHFKSKDDLISEASALILQENLGRMLEVAAAAPADRRLDTILDKYLSPQHRDNPAMGCALPSLVQELSRRPDAVRDTFTKSIDSVFTRLAAFMPGDTDEARKSHAIALLSGMAGAVQMARAVTDRTLSDRILTSARKSFSRCFTG